MGQLDAAVHVRPYPGAPRGGDFGIIRPLDEGVLLALVDAVGHGLTAYAAAQIALRTLHSTARETPDAILAELHEALKSSVGAVAAVAVVTADRIKFAGLGNISAWWAGQRLLSQGGALGQRYRTPRVTECTVTPGRWLIMHTDGVSFAGGDLPAGEAATLARGLVEKGGKSHDDAAVLAARWLEVMP